MTAWQQAKKVAKNAATLKYAHYGPSLIGGFLTGGPAGLATAAASAAANQTSKELAANAAKNHPIGAVGLAGLTG